MGTGAKRRKWVLLALLSAAALVLRLLDLSKVAPDPFYDAAVRSMGLSWHNFFFGAFEPGGSVSIDKPPVDLWLQVVSVKLLGFSTTTLKLPEAFAGVATVPLLWACVRRVWGPAAGLAARAARERFEDPVLVVAPTDHFIRDEARFSEALTEAVREAKKQH